MRTIVSLSAGLLLAAAGSASQENYSELRVIPGLEHPAFGYLDRPSMEKIATIFRLGVLPEGMIVDSAMAAEMRQATAAGMKAAYRDLFGRRRALMEQWAAFLAGAPSGSLPTLPPTARRFPHGCRPLRS